MAKEVLRYRQALWLGFEEVRRNGLLTANHIVRIQAELGVTAPASVSCRGRRSKMAPGVWSTLRRRTRARSST
jgi:hypothetical protein